MTRTQAALLLLLGACTEDEPGASPITYPSIDDVPLAGTVAGQPWEPVDGHATFSPERGSYQIRIHSETLACDAIPTTPGLLLWANPGTYEDFNGMLVVLDNGFEPLHNREGRLEVIESDDGLSVGIVFPHDVDNYVEGWFSARRCGPPAPR